MGKKGEVACDLAAWPALLPGKEKASLGRGTCQAPGHAAWGPGVRTVLPPT